VIKYKIGDLLVACDGAKSLVRKQRCAEANNGTGFKLLGKLRIFFEFGFEVFCFVSLSCIDVGVSNIGGTLSRTILERLPKLSKMLEFVRVYSHDGMSLLLFRYRGDGENAEPEVLNARKEMRINE
jgi:hypothetical protein